MTATSFVRSLYDELTEAVEDKGEARKVVVRVAREVGVDIYTNVEGDDVWSHANLLRVLRAVQGLRFEVARLKGLPIPREGQCRSVAGW